MRSKAFLKYDRLTGEIVSTGSANEPYLQAAGQPGIVSIPGTADPRTEYVDLRTEAIVPKRAATFTTSKTSVLGDGIDEVLLHGLSEGDEITIRRNDRTMDHFFYTDEDSSLTFPASGRYTIHARSVQQLESEVTIDAT